jgi:hypothetical protein
MSVSDTAISYSDAAGQHSIEKQGVHRMFATFRVVGW